MEQQGLRDWMRKIENDLARMEDKWQKSVDDIKSTMRAEIADLKSEQIADLKARVQTMDQRMDGQNVLISDLRTNQDKFEAGAGIVGWLIKTTIALGSLAIGYFGAKHIG